MRTTSRGVLAVLMLASAVAAAGGATVVVKEGTGEAAIGKDEQASFEEARQQAIRNAIEQAAGVRIDAFTETVNNQLVRDQVLANTSGYAKKVDVVSKKKERGVISVTVRAEVITENLDKDIRAAQDLVKTIGRPSLVIVIQEQTVPLSGKVLTNTDTMATVLTDVFKADGWRILDAQALNKSLKLDPAATLGPTDAKQIKDLTGAQYVLYGTAVFHYQDPTGLGTQQVGEKQVQTYFPVTGEYSLAFAATDSADQPAKVAGALSGDVKTLQRQSLLSYARTTYAAVMAKRDEFTGPIRKRVLEHFRSQLVDGMEIDVRVSGLDSFTSARQFASSLKEITGVKVAVADSFAKGTAKYRVTFLGTPARLAEQVESSTFRKKKLTVSEVTANTMQIDVGR